MVLETGVIVAGTGYAGSAVTRHLADSNAPYVLLDKKQGEMIYDIILAETGEVAGALVVRNGRVEPLRAPVIILATGGMTGLFPGGDWRQSADGLAVAHRAGLRISTPVLDPDRGLHAGVPCKADGTTALKGLFVAGSLGADRPDPERVARAAVIRSREGAAPLGAHHEHPTVDDPLPKGFASVKFERLRALCANGLTGTSRPDPRVIAEVHRLKGEADEYARARTDVELFSLQNACEVALLLMRTA